MQRPKVPLDVGAIRSEASSNLRSPHDDGSRQPRQSACAQPRVRRAKLPARGMAMASRQRTGAHDRRRKCAAVLGDHEAPPHHGDLVAAGRVLERRGQHHPVPEGPDGRHRRRVEPLQSDAGDHLDGPARPSHVPQGRERIFHAAGDHPPRRDRHRYRHLDDGSSRRTRRRAGRLRRTRRSAAPAARPLHDPRRA